jgi:hypothetical protein
MRACMQRTLRGETPYVRKLLMTMHLSHSDERDPGWDADCGREFHSQHSFEIASAGITVPFES